MASVFLSYDREDTALAGSVARALEKAGHSVWWDRQIAGGAQHEAKIEETDQVFDALMVWPGSDLRQVLQPLFRPALEKFRQEPGFMIVAKRFRLIHFWQKSGKWPDFCFESDQPYDCEAEAAKAMAETR